MDLITNTTPFWTVLLVGSIASAGDISILTVSRGIKSIVRVLHTEYVGRLYHVIQKVRYVPIDIDGDALIQYEDS